jgi:hypothetical protein
MPNEVPELNKRTNAYRRQKHLETEAAFREIADKERRERERKTAELREQREAMARSQRETVR